MARRQYDDDDGRVIAPMNVEGMPWYQKHPPEQPQRDQQETLTNRQTAQVIVTATLTALGVGLIFCAGLVLLVLFLKWIWHV